jgi:hypothetical protein
MTLASLIERLETETGTGDRIVFQEVMQSVKSAKPTPPADLLKWIANGDMMTLDQAEHWLRSCRVRNAYDKHPVLFDLQKSDFCYHPRSRQEVIIFEGVSAATFVLHLIKLHRLGIDAGALCAIDALRTRLAKQKTLSPDELKIVWGRKRLACCKPLIIRTAEKWTGVPQATAGLNGFTLTIGPDQEGNATLVGARSKGRKTDVQAALFNKGAFGDLAHYFRNRTTT